jgi:hypothetical protein
MARTTTTTRNTRSNKLAALMKQKSVGQSSKFVTDVVGVLTELLSPSDTDREETYEYEGQTRPSAWRAVIVTPSGDQFYWNWPGYLDSDGDNMPGVNILAEGLSLGEVLGTGMLCRFYRDPKSRRSTVTPVTTSTNAAPVGSQTYMPMSNGE